MGTCNRNAVKESGAGSLSDVERDAIDAQIRELKEARGKLWRRSIREVVEDIPDEIQDGIGVDLHPGQGNDGMVQGEQD